MHDVYQVVALAEHLVNFSATLAELAPEAVSDGVLDNLWVRLVTDSVDVVFGDDVVEAGGRGLQIVQRISHVALCCENQRLDTLVVCLKLL